MFRIIGGIILVGMVMATLKLALVGMLMAGLIFRTKETLGLMLLFAAIALLSAYPVAGFSLIVIGGLWAWLRSTKQPETGADFAPLPPRAPTGTLEGPA